MKKYEVRKAIKFRYPSEVPIKTEDILGAAFDKYGDALRKIFKRYHDSSISPDMPLENIEVLFKTAKEYRYK